MAENDLNDYATRFFGFGDWNADYWLIGREERGAQTDREFCRRFRAWRGLSQKEGPVLLDLRTFAREAQISLDWNNRTWTALYRTCCLFDERLPALDKHNQFWGGAEGVARGSGHVALIEAMAFPAENAGQWPYQRWPWDFMAERDACEDKFLEHRIQQLLHQVREHHPRVILDYGAVCKGAGVDFSAPVLFRQSLVENSLWIQPIQVAGSYPFGKEARDQVVQQIRSVL